MALLLERVCLLTRKLIVFLFKRGRVEDVHVATVSFPSPVLQFVARVFTLHLVVLAVEVLGINSEIVQSQLSLVGVVSDLERHLEVLGDLRAGWRRELFLLLLGVHWL